MSSLFQYAASQIVILTALVLLMNGHIGSAEEKSKSGSSSVCTSQIVTDMKTALTDCMPAKGGQQDKGKGTKSGNLLDADRALDIEPRLAFLQQSSGGGGGGGSSGSGQDSGAKGAKSSNDSSPLVCTLTKMKGKNKNLDEVMTQCQQQGANSSSSSSSSDSKNSKTASSGSSQAQKEKQDKAHGGGAQGGNSAGNAMEMCISQKLNDLCPDLQSDPTVAAAFPATAATTSDDKDKKNKGN